MMLSFLSFFIFSPPGKPFPVSQSGGRRAPATVMSNVWLPYCDSLWLCMWQICFPSPTLWVTLRFILSLLCSALLSWIQTANSFDVCRARDKTCAEQQIVCISVGFPTGSNQCFYCQCIQQQRCLPFWAFSCVCWIGTLKRSKHGGGGGDLTKCNFTN